MKIEDSKALLKKFVDLAHQEITGPPQKLAERFGVSVRSIYRLKQELLRKGFSIRYSRVRKSYVIE